MSVTQLALTNWVGWPNATSFSGSISSASLVTGNSPKDKGGREARPWERVGPNGRKKKKKHKDQSERKSSQINASVRRGFRSNMLSWGKKPMNVLNPRQTGRGNEWLVESQYHRSLLDRR